MIESPKPHLIPPLHPAACCQLGSGLGLLGSPFEPAGMRVNNRSVVVFLHVFDSSRAGRCRVGTGRVQRHGTARHARHGTARRTGQECQKSARAGINTPSERDFQMQARAVVGRSFNSSWVWFGNPLCLLGRKRFGNLSGSMKNKEKKEEHPNDRHTEDFPWRHFHGFFTRREVHQTFA